MWGGMLGMGLSCIIGISFA
jgi:growth hormone-inducible transmembrane protein